jgi:hypothetical protein
MVHNPFHGLMRRGRQPSMQFQQLNPAYQSDPRRILGQALMQQGSSFAPVRTPLQGLGRLSSALVGAYLQRQAGDAQAAREDKARDALLASLPANASPRLRSLVDIAPNALQNAMVTQAMQPTSALKTQDLPGAPGAVVVGTEQTSPLGGTTFIPSSVYKPPVPKNTRRDMSPAEVAATGRDPTLGIYQIDANGQIFPPSGAQVTGNISNRYDAMDEVVRLSQIKRRTPTQQARFNLLTADLAKPRPITIPDNAGGTTVVMQPGINVNEILGGTTSSGQPITQGDPTAGITVGTDVAGIPGGTIVGKKPDQLTTQESEFVADAASASADLNTVIEIMFNGDLTGGDYNQSVAIASGTSVGRAASGDAQRLFDALNNLVDLRLRQRTGATANQEEVENYLNAVLPGLTTRPDTQRARVERLITELNEKIKAFKGGRNIPGLSVITIPKAAANDSDEFKF